MAEPVVDLESKWAEVLSSGQLQLPFCDECSGVNWYPLPRCGRCGASAFSWRIVPNRGSVHSFTKVHRSFVGGVAAPYVVALIEVESAGGARLPCRGADANETLNVGDQVTLQADTAGDGAFWRFQRST